MIIRIEIISGTRGTSGIIGTSGMWGITGTKIYCTDFFVRLELSYEIGFQGKIYFLWDPFFVW